MDLPTDAVAYARIEFSAEVTGPAGLLQAHTTKASAWAMIHVLAGRQA